MRNLFRKLDDIIENIRLLELVTPRHWLFLFVQKKLV